MLLRSAVLAASLSVFLSACGSSGGAPLSSKNESSTDGIQTVYTDIFHYHPSFFGKWPGFPAREIGFSFVVRLGDDLDSIETAIIDNDQRDEQYTLIDTGMGIDRTENFQSFYQAHGLNQVYSASNTTRINMQDWSVQVTDDEGNESSLDFEFPLPNNTDATFEEYVYAATDPSPTVEGVAALEAMNIADNDLSFAKNVGAETFTVNFTPTDARAEQYMVLYLGDAPSYETLGQSNHLNSDTVADNPLSTNMETSITIPWSEVEETFDPADVEHIHIFLFNEETDISYAEESVWYTYVGVSELVSL